MLLISSIIISSFIKYPLILSRSCSIPSIYSRSATHIISFLFLLYLVLTGVVSNSILSIVLVIHCFATSKVHMVFLVSIFYRSALNCVQLCCVLSINLFNLSRFVVSLIYRRSNLVYLFSSSSFSLRCHPRSRDEILS